MHRLTVTPDVVLRESSIESRLVPAFAAHGSFLSRRLPQADTTQFEADTYHFPWTLHIEIQPKAYSS